MNPFKTILLVSLSAAFFSCQSGTGKKDSNQDQQSAEPTSEMEDTSRPGVPIHEAALSGNIDAVDAHINIGTDIDASNAEGHTPLMLAAFNGHTKVVEKLLDTGADINKTDNKSLTPLHFAASGPSPETVELLLTHGAKVNAIDDIEDFTPLMYAASEGNTEVVKALLNHGADITLQDEDGDSAETFARQNNHEEIVQILQNHK